MTDARVPVPTPPPKRPFADTVRGIVLTDSLRWMEDTSNAEVQRWIAAESTYTASIFARLVARDTLAARVGRAMQDLPTLDRVVTTPARLFLTRWLGASPSLFAVDARGSAERLLIADTTLASVRHGAALRAVSPSWDGRYVALGTTERGDVRAAISVLDATTGRLLHDTVPDLLTTTSGTRYEVTWLPDNRGFIYPRLWPQQRQAASAGTLARGRQFVHMLGTPQSADVPLFGFGVDPSVTLAPDDLPTRVLTAAGSTWLMGAVFRARQNGSEWYMARFRGAVPRRWTQIATIDDRMSAPQLRGDTLYAIRRRGADRGAIVRRLLAEVRSGDTAWVTVVPEGRGVLMHFTVQADGLYFTVREGGTVSLHHMPVGASSGTPVLLPQHGTATLVRGGASDSGVVVSVEDWATPPSWFRVQSGRATPLGVSPGGRTAAIASMVSERLEMSSTDGTAVPVSVVYDRERMGARDGHAPLLVEAYAAYGQSTDAAFTPRVQSWVALGGVYAYVHARGGGEKGDVWHRAAIREHKQRTIDDVVSAIDGLIARGYSAPGRVVVMGTSSGALIPGLVAVQRPDLLGAALFEVGQPDEVRGAQLDPTAARNIAELGDMDTAEGVHLLMRSSPYYQVPAHVRLPAMLIHSASGDYNFGGEMVMAKYVARLQAANSGTRPIVWVRTDGGHGELFYKSPAWGATVLSFALWQVGDPRFQPN